MQLLLICMGMNKVSLQKTVQPFKSLPNAIRGEKEGKPLKLRGIIEYHS